MSIVQCPSTWDVDHITCPVVQSILIYIATNAQPKIDCNGKLNSIQYTHWWINQKSNEKIYRIPTFSPISLKRFLDMLATYSYSFSWLKQFESWPLRHLPLLIMMLWTIFCGNLNTIRSQIPDVSFIIFSMLCDVWYSNFWSCSFQYSFYLDACRFRWKIHFEKLKKRNICKNVPFILEPCIEVLRD